MGIIGVLWLIILVLKIVGVVTTGWLLVLFWPVLVWVVLIVLAMLGLTTMAGISSIGRSRKR